MARMTKPEMEALGRKILPPGIRKEIYATRRHLGGDQFGRMALQALDLCPLVDVRRRSTSSSSTTRARCSATTSWSTPRPP